MTFPRVTYPTTRRDAVRDVYHGIAVDDPYRWLEDPASSDTQAWIDAQNELTRWLLDGPLRERLREQLTRLYDYDRSSAPVPRGSRYFFTRNTGLQNQPVLYVQDELDSTPRVLLDPNVLSADGTSALTAWEPSPHGRYVAYALSHGGSDWQTLHVLDVERGTECADDLRWAKFVSIGWDAMASGFYYTRFPENASYHPSVWWHSLGHPQSEDRMVYGPSSDPEVVFEVDLSSDHRLLVVTAFKGASEKSAVTVLDAVPPGSESSTPRFQISTFDHAWSFIDAQGDTLYFRTNLAAPRGRIVAVQSGGTIREVAREGSDSLIDARVVGGHVAALYLRNASSRVQLFQPDGRKTGDVTLPALGSVTEMTGEADGHELFLRFESFTWPPTVLRYSLSDGSVSTFSNGTRDPRPSVSEARGLPAFAREARCGEADRRRGPCSRWQTHQVWYPSRDGTAVSMFLVHAADLARDGKRPVWLTGYGGFNVSVVPHFDPGHLLWLDRGGVLAVPNLRGGGEYGDAWHHAGMLEKRQNVFDDFIAAAEWLIAQGYTCARRLVLEGGSNGGLLVAVALTQRPDLPGAVVCRVPVADMFRYHLFTVGRFWVPEYGCAEVPGQFMFLRRYSPLHNLRDEVPYPPVLITTADTDDRVDPGMARKLAAGLQAASIAGGGGPALIRIERRAGHGAGKPVAKQIEEDADIYAFVASALDFVEAATEN